MRDLNDLILPGAPTVRRRHKYFAQRFQNSWPKLEHMAHARAVTILPAAFPRCDWTKVGQCWPFTASHWSNLRHLLRPYLLPLLLGPREMRCDENNTAVGEIQWISSADNSYKLWKVAWLQNENH